MSIIHEALKKVEASNKPQAKDKPVNKIKPDLKIYALYLAIAALGFICANFIFSFFTKPLQTTQAKTTLMNPPREPPSSLPALPQETVPLDKETLPSLILNGVFFSGEQGYALINNQIVKEGEKVSGATVVRISLEGVELKSKDSTIKLPK